MLQLIYEKHIIVHDLGPNSVHSTSVQDGYTIQYICIIQYNPENLSKLFINIIVNNTSINIPVS
jgi:hypothetical protein